jgi:hypothetical protein
MTEVESTVYIDKETNELKLIDTCPSSTSSTSEEDTEIEDTTFKSKLNKHWEKIKNNEKYRLIFFILIFALVSTGVGFIVTKLPDSVKMSPIIAMGVPLGMLGFFVMGVIWAYGNIICNAVPFICNLFGGLFGGILNAMDDLKPCKPEDQKTEPGELCTSKCECKNWGPGDKSGYCGRLSAADSEKPRCCPKGSKLKRYPIGMGYDYCTGVMPRNSRCWLNEMCKPEGKEKEGFCRANNYNGEPSGSRKGKCGKGKTGTKGECGKSDKCYMDDDCAGKNGCGRTSYDDKAEKECCEHGYGDTGLKSYCNYSFNNGQKCHKDKQCKSKFCKSTGLIAGTVEGVCTQKKKEWDTCDGKAQGDGECEGKLYCAQGKQKQYICCKNVYSQVLGEGSGTQFCKKMPGGKIKYKDTAKKEQSKELNCFRDNQCASGKCKNSKCVPQKKLGESCPTTYDYECEGTLNCAQGANNKYVCCNSAYSVLAGKGAKKQWCSGIPNNKGCYLDNQCSSTWCKNNRCSPPASDGQPCSSNGINTSCKGSLKCGKSGAYHSNSYKCCGNITSNAITASQYCNSNSRNGTACLEDNQCKSKSCNGNGGVGAPGTGVKSGKCGKRSVATKAVQNVSKGISNVASSIISWF